jgi:cell division protein FtsB
LPAATTIEELRAEQKTLQTQIEELLERIESIGSQPPFTWREQLEDEAWVAMRRMELELKISELEARRMALESHLRKLLSGSDYGKCFGPN